MTATDADVREKRKLRASLCAALVGIGICGLIGPLLPLLVMLPTDAFHEKHSVLYALSAFRVLPWVVPFAVIFAGPCGAILGALGALWIRFRSRSQNSGRLLLETILSGFVLGTIVPSPWFIFDSDPNLTGLKAFALMGASSGIVCAVLVFLAMNRFGLLAEKSNLT